MAKATTLLNNHKLRHSTGAYLHMNDAPTEEDIIFFLSSQKLMTADISTIIKAFGEHKTDRIEVMLRSLNTKLCLKREGEDNNIITLTRIK